MLGVHLVLGLDSQERWVVLVGMLTAILGLLGAMIRGGWKAASIVFGQLEATRDNTAAIHELTVALKEQAERITALERGNR